MATQKVSASQVHVSMVKSYYRTKSGVFECVLLVLVVGKGRHYLGQLNSFCYLGQFTIIGSSIILCKPPFRTQNENRKEGGEHEITIRNNNGPMGSTKNTHVPKNKQLPQ